MAQEQYDANQGAVPPIPDPSDNLTPPPAPANPQDATAQAPVVPQTGETFTPMSEKRRSHQAHRRGRCGPHRPRGCRNRRPDDRELDKHTRGASAQVP